MESITIFIALAAGIAIGLFVLKPRTILTAEEYQQKADKKINKANEEAKVLNKQALERASKFGASFKEDTENRKEQLKRVENLIASKEEQSKNKTTKNNELNKIIEAETAQINSIKENGKKLNNEMTDKLTQITGQSIDQTKVIILAALKSDLELTKEDRIHKYEEYLEENKMNIAKNMVTDVIQRYSSPTSVEKKSTIITVKRDEVKGRIAGHDGENVAMLEELTGVDVIFNDSPNTIIVSCFDLVRKHIARETIMKLKKERRITPDMIKNTVKKVEAETEKLLIKIGRDTVEKLELVHRKFPDDFYRIIGRLQFRTSYGQNILKHSFEVGNFTLMLGSELDLDMETCKIGGFFHDLGKAIDQELDESHDVLTKQIMEKYDFSEEEIHAAWTHHDAIPIRTAEALLVKAGDAISAGRPGARQESLEKYIERINAIEGIGTSYEGVKKAYAISAGRELRVMVEPKELDDENLSELAETIAVEIQDNVAYPGKIKVNVIRRTEITDHAK